MTDDKYTASPAWVAADLKRMRAWSFEHKIGVAQTRICEWYEHYSCKVSVSFSGVVDSTLALFLARKCYPDIEAVFAHTGLELPEQVAFIRSAENVTFVTPKKRYPEIIKEYGFCYPSKDASLTLYYSKRGSKWALDRLNGVNKDGSPSAYRQSRYGKWKYLLNSGYNFAPHCCKFLKEKPLDEYGKQTGKMPIIGTLAEESRRRTESWLRVGCNAFNKARPSSQPLSFFTKSDVFRAIKEFGVPYCRDIYGKIVSKDGVYSCTGQARSGCAACLVGIHRDKPNKLQLLKQSYPKLHDYYINSLGIGDLLDYLGVDYGGRDYGD